MGIPQTDSLTIWTMDSNARDAVVSCNRGSTMSSLRVHHHDAPWTMKNPFMQKKKLQQVQPASTKAQSTKPTATELPQEVVELKQKILAANHEKSYRFRMSCLKKKAIPVALPKPYDDKRAMSTMVAGHRIAMTRGMWENSKKKNVVRLNRILEDAPYEYLW